VRHAPVTPGLFDSYVKDALNRIDALPTCKLDAPHSIRRRTQQNKSCNACHGHVTFFLGENGMAPWERKANSKVIVPNINTPKPVKEELIGKGLLTQFKPETDTLIIFCSSGSRSCTACNEAIKAGFKETKILNLMGGFEGDKNNNKESSFYGQRWAGGWKLEGLPLTYKMAAQIHVSGRHTKMKGQRCTATPI
jgi:rhodanese-related sulfurtransferase